MHNHINHWVAKTITTVPKYHIIKETHISNITILIALAPQWFIWLCTTPACFSTFYYHPYFSWKFQIFLFAGLLTFLQMIILSGEPTHSTSKGIVLYAPVISRHTVSAISFKPQKVWGSIVNPLLCRISASYHPRFTLWVWQQISVIFQ